MRDSWKGETDLSYLSAFYYNSAVLLLITSVFAALSHSWGMAATCFIWEAFSISYRVRARKNAPVSCKLLIYIQLLEAAGVSSVPPGYSAVVVHRTIQAFPKLPMLPRYANPLFLPNPR